MPSIYEDQRQYQCTYPHGRLCQQCNEMVQGALRLNCPQNLLRWQGNGRTWFFTKTFQYNENISEREVRTIASNALSVLTQAYPGSNERPRLEYAYHAQPQMIKVHLMVDTPTRDDLADSVVESMFAVSNQDYNSWQKVESQEHALRRRLQFLQGQNDPNYRFSDVPDLPGNYIWI
ncbi:hypothetical protein BJY04DRAFT_214757 [Aspergillus karnatakaensis]|uniref:uncharacterized protein n=1 Tax=Aspergillus karnatakaensis TaxID=1810916 RepID=UPI003CCDF98A